MNLTACQPVQRYFIPRRWETAFFFIHIYIFHVVVSFFFAHVPIIYQLFLNRPIWSIDQTLTEQTWELWQWRRTPHLLDLQKWSLSIKSSLLSYPGHPILQNDICLHIVIWFLVFISKTNDFKLSRSIWAIDKTLTSTDTPG